MTKPKPITAKQLLILTNKCAPAVNVTATEDEPPVVAIPWSDSNGIRRRYISAIAKAINKRFGL